MTDRTQKLSEHFTLGDFLVDATFPALAAELEPDEATVANLRRLAGAIEQVITKFPGEWKVLSGFRDVKLNEACRNAGLPASVDSLHLTGCAADVEPQGDVDLEAVFEWVTEQAKGDDLGVHESVFYPLKGFIHIGVEDERRPTAKRFLMRT
ncbi:MAG: D-Ala-D-Ala carboxypeptidase family metallohydrolase [Deltaproteobacteria bacterium]|jgi:uncharacterized protein YcbK (DUF882 family)